VVSWNDLLAIDDVLVKGYFAGFPTTFLKSIHKLNKVLFKEQEGGPVAQSG